ncbi:hypothetical protein PVAP13_7KG228155 [Panicum virgatum]|uniref:Uncharacterized protein n=1 Tax=Panicum virgatum TaxID=38727 RepID=A0A8T0QDG1_PANVG|nr:hypothetical protein PVAP13_7KG228155 [Panicum virgatum]
MVRRRSRFGRELELRAGSSAPTVMAGLRPWAMAAATQSSSTWRTGAITPELPPSSSLRTGRPGTGHEFRRQTWSVAAAARPPARGLLALLRSGSCSGTRARRHQIRRRRETSSTPAHGARWPRWSAAAAGAGGGRGCNGRWRAPHHVAALRTAATVLALARGSPVRNDSARCTESRCRQKTALCLRYSLQSGVESPTAGSLSSLL